MRKLLNMTPKMAEARSLRFEGKSLFVIGCQMKVSKQRIHQLLKRSDEFCELKIGSKKLFDEFMREKYGRKQSA